MPVSPLRPLLRAAARPARLAVALVAVSAAAGYSLGPRALASEPLASEPAANVQTSVYVSPSGSDSNPGTATAPVRTVQAAQSIVRSLNQNMTGDVDVVLEDGFYRMSSPLVLGAADSGTNGHNVVWTAASGARPVLAGSAQITGWAPMSSGSPIWVAQAPTGLQTRQLYVNGVRAARANGALPNSLSGQDSSGYSGGGSAMAAWRDPSGASPQLEFVYRGGLGAWTEPRCPVASFSGDAVNMAQPCWSNSTTRACCFPDGRAYNLVGRQSITEQPTSVENAFQLLGSNTPGQWFLDRGDSKLYYVPRPGENLASADVEAPVLQQLVTGGGSASAPLHNVVFSGIQFSYATWLGPDFHGQGASDGFSEIQANYQVTGSNGAASQGLCTVPPPSYTLGACPYAAWTQIPASVSLTYDTAIQFTGDAFVHLGAAGLTLGDGSQGDLVRGDVVTDTSGSGIQLGNVDKPTATGADQTSGDTVADNHVFGTSVEFHGGIGIDSGYTARDTISHNQIDHTPYTAISMGWGGWPDKEKEAPQPNFSQGDTVADNLIFDHMSLLNDGGGIYTQGITGASLSTGEHVTGNLIHDQTGSGHVIYTDNGCTYESILGNGIYNNTNAVAWASRHTDYAPGATTTYDPTDVENNYWENPSGYTTGGGVTVANNTTITAASQIPSSITANAGLEPAYQGLLNWTQAPLPPVPGHLLSGLVVNDAANAANWSLQTDLQAGDVVNGDRTYTFAAIPAALTGAEWVRTANNSKTATVNPLVSFDVAGAATVYVGVDTRSGKRPWMDATWTDIGTTITTSESGTIRTFELYTKQFAAGQVALGPDAANTDMYTITVLPTTASTGTTPPQH